MNILIEQRLQDPPRFMVLPADEAVAIGLPVMLGLMSRQIIVGVVIGAVIWMVWKRLKGDTGLPGLLAAIYWYLPTQVSAFRELPDSAVTVWEA